MPDAVTVHTPSTIGNFGPGFDATSLALAWGGDRITARYADGDRITVAGAGAAVVPTDWDANCAAVAYARLREREGRDEPVHLHIEKGVPPGSGLGSSASSSAGGALAFASLHRDLKPWTPLELVEAATYGESRVAGAHGDDVAAAVQGGLSLVRAGEVRRVTPPPVLHLAIVRPDLALETRKMRAAVSASVPLRDAVGNLQDLAFLIDALHRGDIDTVARSLTDRVATPGRRVHVPFFAAAEAAARSAGAPGIALAGSGPSLFTVAESLSTARDLASAMAEAVRGSGLAAEAIACPAERRVVWQEELSR